MKPLIRNWGVLATLAILFTVSAGAGDGIPATALIEFEIKDQFDHAHTERELLGRTVLIFCSDKKGSRYQDRWKASLVDSLGSRGHLDDVTMVEIADLRGVPFFVKGSVKKKFPRDRTSRVLLDWKGRFAKSYQLRKDRCSIVLFDHSGTQIHTVSVTELSPPVLVEIMDHIKATIR
jgi:predicted transcriptional regulator